MKNMMTTGLWAVGGFVLLIAVASSQLLKFDGPGWAGVGIGALVGLINLALGGWLLKRNIKAGGNPMTGVAGGFLARLFVLAALTIVFQRTAAVDATAFALVFMMFFFLFVALEIYMVGRVTNERRVTT